MRRRQRREDERRLYHQSITALEELERWQTEMELELDEEYLRRNNLVPL